MKYLIFILIVLISCTDKKELVCKHEPAYIINWPAGEKYIGDIPARDSIIVLQQEIIKLQDQSNMYENEGFEYMKKLENHLRAGCNVQPTIRDGANQ